TDTVSGRVRAGAAQQDLLKVQTQYRLAENELSSMESEAKSMRAMLNAMMGRDAAARLEVTDLPAPRTVAVDDAKLIAIAVSQNPELSALAQQVKGREDALELARLAYIPDINPMAAFTGSISQSVGAVVMLPTALPR